MTTRMYDTVYYWKGGTANGRWYATLITPEQIDDTLAGLRRAGYHAVPGCTAIGAPEGAPYSDAYREWSWS